MPASDATRLPLSAATPVATATDGDNGAPTERRALSLSHASGAISTMTIDLGSPVLDVISVGPRPSIVIGAGNSRSAAFIAAMPDSLFNGVALQDGMLGVVRPGGSFTLRTAGASQILSFTLLEQPARWPQSDFRLPAGAASLSGRWQPTSRQAPARLVEMAHQQAAAITRLPELLDHAPIRAAMGKILLRAIAAISDGGTFHPDRATAGRHSQIMLRLAHALENADFKALDVAELCRRTATSRRTLEAVVLARTGKPLGDYTRECRLMQAREFLRRPSGATNVTETAFRLGFWHLGRFAARYKEMFGELPSETLKRTT